MNKSIFFILILGSFFALTSCDDNDNPTPTENYKAILDNTGENIILKTYQSLATQAVELETATQTLETNPTQANLDAARSAWVATRAPWEQSEGFLFGPVDQEGIDPSIDSWPVNVIDLNNVLASANPLTIAFLAQQEGTLKGFHTIEFLLWGETGAKQVGDITAREFEYLAAAAGVLADDTQTLYDLWKPSGGNFISNILNAGNGSQIYVSQKSALEEFTNALIIIADEVGNGKINDPFVQQDLTLEESRFSANSKADFANNIRSVKHIYTGIFGVAGDGHALSDIIKEKNAAVDAEVIAKIDAAINAIETIPGTFSDAVFNNVAAVSAAQQAVRDLQATLEEKVLPIISNL